MYLYALLCCLYGCKGEEQFSTMYRCTFVFYASDHPTSALTLVLTNPGQFVAIEPKFVAGVTHLYLTPNQGSWEAEQTDIAMITEIENRRLTYDAMGANRRLIIGCSNFNGLKCFDGQCPNCLQNTTSPNCPLTWTERGQMLECKKCHTVYNPNAEGTPVNGNENTPRLIEYRIEYNGQRLYAHN
jgi:hypothetical protein